MNVNRIIDIIGNFALILTPSIFLAIICFSENKRFALLKKIAEMRSEMMKEAIDKKLDILGYGSYYDYDHDA